MQIRIFSYSSLIFTALLCVSLVGCGYIPFGGKSHKAHPAHHAAPRRIALLLPISGKLSPVGRAVKDGFMSAHTLANAPSTVSFFDTSTLPIDHIAQQVEATHVNFAIGPLDKAALAQWKQIHPDKLTTLALNYSEGGGSASDLYEFGLLPQDEAQQAATHAWNAGKRRALIIAPAAPWAENIVRAFHTEWRNAGGEIADSWRYGSTQALDNGLKQFLHVRINAQNQVLAVRKDADMIFLVAYPSIARQVVPLLNFYNAHHFAVYSTSVVYGGSANPDLDNDLNGVVFCDIPWILGKGSEQQEQHNIAGDLWPENLPGYSRMYALGADAYKIMTELARSEDPSALALTGNTGSLWMDNENRIHRKLSCAQFSNGIPVIISQ